MERLAPANRTAKILVAFLRVIYFLMTLANLAVANLSVLGFGTYTEVMYYPPKWNFINKY